MNRSYVILTQKNGAWVELETHIPASSAKAALRALLDGETEPGTFVAIPARSWNPVTVKVETKTQLTFS